MLHKTIEVEPLMWFHFFSFDFKYFLLDFLEVSFFCFFNHFLFG